MGRGVGGVQGINDLLLFALFDLVACCFMFLARLYFAGFFLCENTSDFCYSI